MTLITLTLLILAVTAAGLMGWLVWRVNRKLLPLILLVCLCGCEAKIKIGSPTTNDPPVTVEEVSAVLREMPPGWRLLCNDAGKFGVGYPSGVDGVGQFESREEAIKFAWEIEGVKVPEIPKWRTCQ